MQSQVEQSSGAQVRLPINVCTTVEKIANWGLTNILKKLTVKAASTQPGFQSGVSPQVRLPNKRTNNKDGILKLGTQNIQEKLTGEVEASQMEFLIVLSLHG